MRAPWREALHQGPPALLPVGTWRRPSQAACAVLARPHESWPGGHCGQTREALEAELCQAPPVGPAGWVRGERQPVIAETAVVDKVPPQQRAGRGQTPRGASAALGTQEAGPSRVQATLGEKGGPWKERFSERQGMFSSVTD